MAQLSEQLLPTPEVHSSNPVMDKIYLHCQPNLNDENKEKEAVKGLIFLIPKKLRLQKLFTKKSIMPKLSLNSNSSSVRPSLAPIFSCSYNWLIKPASLRVVPYKTCALCYYAKSQHRSNAINGFRDHGILSYSNQRGIISQKAQKLRRL